MSSTKGNFRCLSCGDVQLRWRGVKYCNLCGGKLEPMWNRRGTRKPQTAARMAVVQKLADLDMETRTKKPLTPDERERELVSRKVQQPKVLTHTMAGGIALKIYQQQDGRWQIEVRTEVAA